MVCQKCGNEVLDESAAYCSACGSRLDGKKACGSCGKLNEAGVTYCVYCGERMDGKTVCSACGTAYEGKFCPSCGKSGFVKIERREAKACNKEKVFGIFDRIGSGLLMLGVLFSLIFVFFISVVADVSVIEITQLGLDADMSIFDYFGKYYQEMDEALAEIEIQWFKGTLSTNELTFGIIGTVIAALTLCAVVGFSIVATVVFVQNWMGLSERKADKWAAATVLSFFAGVVMFFGLHKLSINYNGVEGAIKLSPATIWGIVLCSITFVCSIACKIVVDGKENLKSKKIIGWCLSGLGVAFCAALLGMLGNFSIISKIGVYNEWLNMSAGTWAANGILIACAELRVEALERGNKANKIFSNVGTYTVLNTVTQIILLIAVVVIVVCMLQKLNGILSQKQSSALPWAIVAVVLTVACLVLSIIAKNYASAICEIDASSQLANVKGSIVMPILLVVFSVLNLAVACVHAAFNRKWKKESIAE